MKSTIVYVVVIVVGGIIGATPSYAQSSELPAPSVEVFGGHAGFVDDATIPYTVLGGAASLLPGQPEGVQDAVERPEIHATIGDGQSTEVRE